MTKNELKDIIDQGDTLKLISTAYAEIATSKLTKIRAAVLQNRSFLENLSNVYITVQEEAIKKRLQALTNKSKSGISIVITSNYHFYGNVNTNLVDFFLNQEKNSKNDQIIIGQTGAGYLSQAQVNSKYQILTLKKDQPQLQELNFIVEKVKEYSKVLVYFSKMKSVMIQEPAVVDITQSSYLKEPKKNPGMKEPLFIFEPELVKILLFFENQVKSLLLQQAFLESELSRTASRLVSMDNAQDNAEDFVKSYKIQLDQVTRSIQNARILETYNALRKHESI